MQKILMIGPGRKGRGGIVKVIEYYKNSRLWDLHNIVWIETHCSGSYQKKIKVFLLAVFKFFNNVLTAKIVHIHFTGSISANRKFFFFVMSKLFKLKTISHIHAPTLEVSKLNSFSFRTMVKYSDVVIVLSPVWSKTLKVLFDRKYFVLNNPSKGFLDIQFSKEKIILFAGRLENRKGYMDLLQALKEINLPQDYNVIFAGNGEIEKANYFIKNNSLKNIYVVGWKNEKDINKLFQRASIFVLPSYGEGFPISIIDALSNRCAVITTPVGGIPDFLEHNNTCLFIQPGDIQALKHALELLIKNETLINKLSLNGYMLAKKEFDIDKIVTKLNMLYKELEN